jgi:trehalose 6-phosphate synthase/phosphatase
MLHDANVLTADGHYLLNEGTHYRLQENLGAHSARLNEADEHGRIDVSGHVVRAGAFPMGVDLQRFETAALNPGLHGEIEALRTTFAPCKVVLSIDRLDYSKGIFNRLRAYEAFLEKAREWREKVVLVLIVVPSRIGVEEYQR